MPWASDTSVFGRHLGFLRRTRYVLIGRRRRLPLQEPQPPPLAVDWLGIDAVGNDQKARRTPAFGPPFGRASVSPQMSRFHPQVTTCILGFAQRVSLVACSQKPRFASSGCRRGQDHGRWIAGIARSRPPWCGLGEARAGTRRTAWRAVAAVVTGREFQRMTGRGLRPTGRWRAPHSGARPAPSYSQSR